MKKERMNIVFTGHVDHGKSTVVGRLLADTHSLPEGKLKRVQDRCARDARPFEYAFLLDALKDEQTQGITIDAARCFFKTVKRDYIIIDAPGHIEFLKNMISGASRAEAAFIVIDAHEGIQENSKRHGYLASLLGIKQISVLVNKMDLIDYRREAFTAITETFTDFLAKINVTPVSFIPVAATEGVNIAGKSARTPWYEGFSVLEQLDAFHNAEPDTALPFRMPVQDVYKFTENGDNRRIIAGTVLSGRVEVGDELVVMPSRKTTVIKTIEAFNAPPRVAVSAGELAGFTFSTQIYLKPGDVLAKTGETPPHTGSLLKTNIFWMGKTPFIKNKKYKMKLAAKSIPVELIEILNVIDASELTTVQTKGQVDRHDVSECVLETAKPLAFDLIHENGKLGRFVIVDNDEISGGGIIIDDIDRLHVGLSAHIQMRERGWRKSKIRLSERAALYNHKSKFILLTGTDNQEFLNGIAQELELKLFNNNYKAYFLGIENMKAGLDLSDLNSERNSQIEKLGELARIFTDAGNIFISAMENCDDFDIEKFTLLNKPYDIMVITVGESLLSRAKPDLNFNEREPDIIRAIYSFLAEKELCIEFSI